MRIDAHTFFAFVDNDALTKIGNFPLLKDKGKTDSFLMAGCFDCFWHNFSPHNNFVFGWAAVPVYFEKLVEKFNNEFENIKLEILKLDDSWYNIGDMTAFFVKPSAFSKSTAAKAVTMTMKISDKYKVSTRKYLSYIVHHMLRLFSYAEIAKMSAHDFTNNVYSEDKSFSQIASDLAKFWYESKYTYRGFGYAPSADNIKLLDDVELVNNVFDKSSVIKQTDILAMLLFQLYKTKSTKELIKELTPIEKRKIFTTSNDYGLLLGDLVGISYKAGTKEEKYYTFKNLLTKEGDNVYYVIETSSGNKIITSARKLSSGGGLFIFINDNEISLPGDQYTCEYCNRRDASAKRIGPLNYALLRAFCCEECIKSERVGLGYARKVCIKHPTSNISNSCDCVVDNKTCFLLKDIHEFLAVKFPGYTFKLD